LGRQFDRPPSTYRERGQGRETTSEEEKTAQSKAAMKGKHVAGKKRKREGVPTTLLSPHICPRGLDEKGSSEKINKVT